VPEQDAEIGTCVIRRSYEAAEHVGVTARLEAEHLPQPVHGGIIDRSDPPIGDRVPKYRHGRLDDDAERLPSSVIIDGVDSAYLHESSLE
jgi:hypothetical protein